MPRIRSALNHASSKVIERNILEQNPEGEINEVPVIALVKEIPSMERIVFRNMRDPGVRLDFHYSSKNIPLTMYKLDDGKEATLPVEVIEHLMDRKVPIYAYRRNSEGLPEMYVKTHKYHFQIQRVRSAA